jgi:molybdopterin converting factor subunit 1
MQIKVLLFAQLRDIANRSEISVNLPEYSSVKDLIEILKERYPALCEHLDYASYAIDNEYVSRDTLLEPECCVALIPPISGG